MASSCSRFGNEGSGAHCGKSGVGLLQGREYSFHVEMSMCNRSGTAWSASMIDEFDGNETFIGTLFVHADPTNPPPEGSTVGGYGGLTTAVCNTCAHMRNRTEPTDGFGSGYGGISFQEYFLGGSFYSSFGWIGPRFFPSSAAGSAGSIERAPAGGSADSWLWRAADQTYPTDDGGKAARRSRGPAAVDTGVVLPTRIMVDSETRAGALSNMSGCIPGYACGGDRVFFQMGQIASEPPAGSHTWIFNGMK
jgi:hypothetical protein